MCRVPAGYSVNVHFTLNMTCRRCEKAQLQLSIADHFLDLFEVRESLFPNFLGKHELIVGQIPGGQFVPVAAASVSQA